MVERGLGSSDPASWMCSRAVLVIASAVLVLSVSVPWVALAAGVETSPAAHGPAATNSQPVAAGDTPSPDADELERRKLQQEIRQLELGNDRAAGPLGWLLTVGPLVTVLIGVITLGAALWKQSRDLAAARTSADDQAAQWRAELTQQQRAESEKAAQWRAELLRLQELDRENRVNEQVRRFDERISAVAANLGSDNPALRLNGAAALGLFTKPRYHDLHCDLLNIVVANLKAKPEDAVSDLLRGHLARLLRLLFEPGRVDPGVGDRLDLTRLNLYRLDLHGLDLRGQVTMDLAFSTLTLANFRECNLFRARGGEAELDRAHFSRAKMDEARFNKATLTQPAYFHETSLVSATFDDAVLPGTDFQRARLQGAKFRRAVLRGAHFEGANLADAYFTEAVLDEAALRSIATGAANWRQARFDPGARERLEALSGKH